MNIKSYFKVLTEDDIEQHELKAKQVFRKEQRLTEQVASKVIDLVESNIKTDAMVESIAQCMKNHGLLDEARLETTYQRALRVLGESTLAVPDEIETEEDLGTVQDENAVEVINEEEFFDIEVNQEENKEESDSEVESETLTEDEAPVVVATINKRQRAINTMIGEVRKGKYSK